MLKFLTVFIALLSGTAVAQQPPVEFTAEQDHQHMMDLLGIKALRRGPSGNDSAPNHANYDEALANPYPDLPDVLTLKNGTKVTTRDQWWTRRRPEIVEDLEREVYGRLPPDIPKGIIGLVNHGRPRQPDDWGALRAWAWGAARGLDYLETDPAVDATHVGIEGVSRYGKAALVALAFEPRFAMGLIGSSGKGGATLHRRNWGEAVENLTGGEYYWMAGNYLKYGASEASFGAKHANDLPVDSHELIAMCAPRLTFISYGTPSQGDARWLDHQGSYMAAVAAGPPLKRPGAPAPGGPPHHPTPRAPPRPLGL